ncbi:MAG: efflux RND transporter periplasmic adaptor subunit [Lacipirellulaceae bacterium]
MTISRNHRMACLALGLIATLGGAASAADVAVVPGVVLRLIDEADAPARVAGWIADVRVREGDRVERGATLALLDDADVRLEVVGAEVERSIAELVAGDDVPERYAAKAAEVAEAELRRSQDSVARFAGSVSRSQLDVERLGLDKARLEHEKAQQTRRQAELGLRLATAKLDVARGEVERRRIVAPLSGVVVEALVRPGEWLEPGQRAFRIVEPRRLKAEGFAAATDARGMAPEMTVELSSAGATDGADDDMRLAVGTLVFVSPEIDPVTGQVRVWAEIDNADGALRPGDRATLRVMGTLGATTTFGGAP